MTEDAGKKIKVGAKSEAHQARLAEALRANLRRRKGQKKARATVGDEGEPEKCGSGPTPKSDTAAPEGS